MWSFYDRGTKVCSNDVGHMQTVAAIPKTWLNPLKVPALEPKGQNDALCMAYDILQKGQICSLTKSFESIFAHGLGLR